MSHGLEGVPGAGDHLSREVRMGILVDSLVVNLAGHSVVEHSLGWVGGGVGGLTVRIEN